ncbi:unnamed protein product [Ectocarpus fasciculatus]
MQGSSWTWWMYPFDHENSKKCRKYWTAVRPRISKHRWWA